MATLCLSFSNFINFTVSPSDLGDQPFDDDLGYSGHDPFSCYRTWSLLFQCLCSLEVAPTPLLAPAIYHKPHIHHLSPQDVLYVASCLSALSPLLVLRLAVGF